MQNSKVLKVILFIAGLMFIGVGLATMLIPVGFVARNGVDISGQITLLNDYRGSGGVILGSGILIMLGVFYSKMRYTSTLLASVLYISFAIGRAISIAMDGMPAEGLVKATVVELIVGFAATFALIKFKEKSSS